MASTLTFVLGCRYCLGIISTVDLRRFCVLSVVTAQGGGQCSTMHAVKIAALSAKGCCTATTMSLTSTKQKDLTRLAKWDLISLIHCSKTDVK